MDWVEAVVDYSTGGNSIGKCEDVSDEVVKHIDGVFWTVCRLIEFLMGKRVGFACIILLSMERSKYVDA